MHNVYRTWLIYYYLFLIEYSIEPLKLFYLDNKIYGKNIPSIGIYIFIHIPIKTVYLLFNK